MITFPKLFCAAGLLQNTTQTFLSSICPTDTVPVAEVWPEVERAECLARGAALKWASGVFCRPEYLERLSQYRKRESQRTASIHTRLKVITLGHIQMQHIL